VERVARAADNGAGLTALHVAACGMQPQILDYVEARGQGLELSRYAAWHGCNGPLARFLGAEFSADAQASPADDGPAERQSPREAAAAQQSSDSPSHDLSTVDGVVASLIDDILRASLGSAVGGNGDDDDGDGGDGDGGDGDGDGGGSGGDPNLDGSRALDHSVVNSSWLSTEGTSPVVDTVIALSTVLRMDLCTADVSGNTPLHHALMTGSDEVAVVLTQYGARVAAANADGVTPLHMVVSTISAERVSLLEMMLSLLEDRAQIDTRDAEGRTPLCLAAATGNADAVSTLLEYGADAGLMNGSGWGPLHAAAYHGFLGVVDALLANPAIDTAARNSDGDTALAVAVRAGHHEVLRALLGSLPQLQEPQQQKQAQQQQAQQQQKKGVLRRRKSSSSTTTSAAGGSASGSAPAPAATPFGDLVHLCVHCGDPRALGEVVRSGRLDVAAVDDAGETPACIAARTGRVDLLRVLASVPRGCAPGSGDRTPLHAACGAGQAESVAVLVDEARCPVDTPDGELITPCQTAVFAGHEGLARAMVQNMGADPRVRNVRGMSLLACAASMGMMGLVKDLVALGTARGVDPNEVDAVGNTALAHATARGHHEIVFELAEAGAVLGPLDVNQMSPLHVAVKNGHFPLAAFLTMYGVHQSRDKTGMTPLHHAATIADDAAAMKMVHMLLSNGADISLRDASGRTAVEVATSQGRDELAAQIREAASFAPPILVDHTAPPTPPADLTRRPTAEEEGEENKN
jgi:ankyrin repeat protein